MINKMKLIVYSGIQRDGTSHSRLVCIDRLYYHSDGTMKRVVMTSEYVSN